MSLYNRWVNTGTTLLAILSVGEIMYITALVVLISDILYYTHCQLPTGSGLVASLFSLPTAFKIKAIQSSPIRRHQVDVIKYHRCLLGSSLLVQIFSVLFCIVSLFRCGEIYRVFLESMVQYQDQIDDKIFVDMVQLMVQCCGTNSNNDWIQIQGAQNLNLSNKEIVDNLLQEDERSLAFMSNLNLNEDKLIPYSCCKLKTGQICNPLNIETISTAGCGDNLTKFIVSVLLTELIIYSFLITNIVYLLYCMKVDELSDEVEIAKSNGKSYQNLRNSKTNWDKFTNSKSAEISPTSHTELILVNEKNM